MMHGMHIAGMDLNLVTVLHALLEEQSVSKAAKRVGLSQSATSHALARLRHLLQDPLFVRTPRGLAPTAKAEAMAERVTAALQMLEGTLFEDPRFDAMTARRTFRVGTSDYAEHVIMPPLLTRMVASAPHMDLWVRPAPMDGVEALAEGRIDLAIQPAYSVARGDTLHSVDLWKDKFVVVMRRGHPLARGRLTVQRYASARHAFVAPGGASGGVVDQALAALGRSRRIAFTTPNFLVAPRVVAETDLVITLASRIATTFAKMLPLVLRKPPVALDGFVVSMFWHARQHDDPAHRFLREAVAQTAQRLQG
jgi:DNA-binding transcriptional LysR family regulator